ncbi:MAG: hypothetical protein LW875_06535 [Proteobacteria bacterium]|jgi:flagellar motor switch protein FliG|nr:hypothetical protein [Pseudomonadota bacterium]
MTSYKGLHHALAALQGLDPTAQAKLLENLAKKDPKLAEALRDELFQFEDIAHLSKADFKKLWFEIPKATWLMALRAAPNSVLKFIAGGLTQRGYEQLAEDLKTLGPQPLSKVQTAQKELLKEIREMAKQGKISLPTKGAGTKMV